MQQREVEPLARPALNLLRFGSRHCTCSGLRPSPAFGDCRAFVHE
jgi:hypothetical protein